MIAVGTLDTTSSRRSRRPHAPGRRSGYRREKEPRMVEISRRRKRSTASNVPRCRRMSNASSGSVSPSIFCASNRWPELLTGRNSVAPWRIPSSIAFNTVNRNPYRDLVPGGFHGFFHHAADPVYGFPVLSLEPDLGRRHEGREVGEHFA